MENNQEFINWLRLNQYGFISEGELHIYVGGGGTTWDYLLPIFKEALINEYNLHNKN